MEQAIQVLSKGFTKNSISVQSIWNWEHYRKGKLIDKWQERNVTTNEGLNKLLDVMFHAVSAITTWYVAIFESDTTPTATTTYAVPVYTECTAYDEATREEFIETAASSQSITNSANRAEFTMNATKTIYGASLVSDNTKGDTAASGAVLYCGSKFSSSKSVASSDVLKCTVTLNASNV